MMLIFDGFSKALLISVYTEISKSKLAGKQIMDVPLLKISDDFHNAESFGVSQRRNILSFNFPSKPIH